jgi:omega-6 fatty acid desaturase (delta-12 desaturase)
VEDEQARTVTTGTRTHFVRFIGPKVEGLSLLPNETSQGQAVLDVPTKAEALGPILSRRFKAYGADARRSILQLATTAALFLALLVLMAAVSDGRYWLTLLLAVPAAGLLVRLFIIQHDCGHGSFFKSRAANDFLGRALSVLTLTPYGSWSQGHAAHHASTGNLDRRGRGDVETWTVAEYRAAAPIKKLMYRLYRNPFVMVGLGAPINFILLQRLPLGHGFRDPDCRRSILCLDLALFVAFGLACAAFGVLPVLATYLPVMIIASWAGNWLFYVQHQFDATHWDRDCDWNFHVAALSGSSYFKLPPILQWFSGSIGLHHVHHLCSRVPNYRLQACLDAAPELHRLTKVITLRQSLGCWQLALWDERRSLLVPFRDLNSGAFADT